VNFEKEKIGEAMSENAKTIHCPHCSSTNINAGLELVRSADQTANGWLEHPQWRSDVTSFRCNDCGKEWELEWTEGGIW
jgi:DNA-directed RNA polymerase subunit RPC12/RpoP